MGAGWIGGQVDCIFFGDEGCAGGIIARKEALKSLNISAHTLIFA